MNVSDFFEKQLKISNKKNDNNDTTTLNELYTKPRKEKAGNMTHFQPQNEGYEQQIDLLYVPNDQGYQYILVCVDQGSRYIDCEGLKDQSSKTVLNALTNKIYKRNILKTPKTIRVDGGSHFLADFKKGLEKLNVQLIVATTGRHRALGLVEAKNKVIGTLIHKLIAQNELSGYSSSKWKEYLPALVEAINKKTRLSAFKKNQNLKFQYHFKKENQ
jgi:hypothetical protein